MLSKKVPEKGQLCSRTEGEAGRTRDGQRSGSLIPADSWRWQGQKTKPLYVTSYLCLFDFEVLFRLSLTATVDHHGKLHAMYGHRSALRATGHKLFFLCEGWGWGFIETFCRDFIVASVLSTGLDCYHSNQLRGTANVQSIHFIVHLFLNDYSLIKFFRYIDLIVATFLYGLIQEMLSRLFKPKEKYFNVAPSEGSLYISSKKQEVMREVLCSHQ